MNNGIYENMRIFSNISGLDAVGNTRRSVVELVSHSFDGGDAVDAQFLPNFPDMDVNGTITDDDISSPYLAEDFVAQEYPAWFGGQEIEKFEFFLG
jgi:hypothetical protein